MIAAASQAAQPYSEEPVLKSSEYFNICLLLAGDQKAVGSNLVIVPLHTLSLFETFSCLNPFLIYYSCMHFIFDELLLLKFQFDELFLHAFHF